MTTKTELIDLIVAKVELTKANAARACDAILDGITDSLKKGEPVVLKDFGTFLAKERAAREGRNPATGEKIKIKATKAVSFKAGKKLKDAVKENA
jgi:DNA-binding protein HU-beta